MRKIIVNLSIFIILALFINCKAFAPENHIINDNSITLVYDNVWGTIYNAEESQCDDTPLITGDGSIIKNPNNASDLRWIAITQYMLKSKWRRSLIDTTIDNRFNGLLSYGDTVYIQSPYNTINGLWIVKDTKNKRYKSPTIDFLQTKNDKNLFESNPNWSGKWENIKIYKIN